MTNKIFYTSDTHFGHKNIIKYGNRYKYCQTVEEMDQLLIDNWNSVVGKEDTVIHLGDVAFPQNNINDIMNQLNGNIHLVLGNHDYKKGKPYSYLDYFFHIYADQIVIQHEMKLVLCHYPIKNWPYKHKGYKHLHGHSHGNDLYDIDAIDVGVDCWDLFPISLEQVKHEFALRKQLENTQDD